ncbi:MAG: hypothetical protein IKS36_07640, partial [Bacteroidales bacterium]|nr:hypothetical protein [Bacteroidales bacterium]
MRPKLYILMTMLLSVAVARGQNDSLWVLRGKVSCKGRPVPYATLQLHGTSIGVSCNNAGE